MRDVLDKKSQLVNKLLNSQHSLERSTETTKSNETDPPLLNLPREIRDKIWEYASRGEAELHQHPGGMPFPRKQDALPAFHLPRVCRQIHCETAKLVYSLSTFAFPCRIKCKACVDNRIFEQWTCVDDGIFEHWNLQANRDAITSIEPNADHIKKYTWLQRRIGRSILGPDCKEGILRVRYPSLRCIYVSKSAVEYTAGIWNLEGTAESLGPQEPENLKQWRRYIERMIKNSEGEDMEVIFRD